MLAVVVKEGDMGLVAGEAGVVLPGKVCSDTAAQVFELVATATEDPDGVAFFAVDEGEEGEVAGRDEIVSLCGLWAFCQ